MGKLDTLPKAIRDVGRRGLKVAQKHEPNDVVTLGGEVSNGKDLMPGSSQTGFVANWSIPEGQGKVLIVQLAIALIYDPGLDATKGVPDHATS